MFHKHSVAIIYNIIALVCLREYSCWTILLGIMKSLRSPKHIDGHH